MKHKIYENKILIAISREMLDKIDFNAKILGLTRAGYIRLLLKNELDLTK